MSYTPPRFYRNKQGYDLVIGEIKCGSIWSNGSTKRVYAESYETDTIMQFSSIDRAKKWLLADNKVAA